MVSVTLEPQVYLAEEVAMDLVVLLEQQVDPAERVQLAPPESEVSPKFVFQIKKN